VDETNFNLIANFVERRRHAKQPVTLIGLAGSSLSLECGQQLLKLLDTLVNVDVEDEPLIFELSKVLDCPYHLSCFAAPAHFLRGSPYSGDDAVRFFFTGLFQRRSNDVDSATGPTCQGANPVAEHLNMRVLITVQGCSCRLFCFKIKTDSHRSVPHTALQVAVLRTSSTRSRSSQSLVVFCSEIGIFPHREGYRGNQKQASHRRRQTGCLAICQSLE